MKQYFVYIVSNQHNTVFYVGVTNNLARRIYEHKNKSADGFTKKYNASKLVYFEIAENPNAAIAREKQLKNWHREWKMNLIKSMNADFKDLAEEI